MQTAEMLSAIQAQGYAVGPNTEEANQAKFVGAGPAGSWFGDDEDAVIASIYTAISGNEGDA